VHYYNRNLGDYAKKAGRLSMLQHGAYTLLLDACYDRERFPTESEAIEWTWASTPEEEQAVRFVLSRFFEKQTDGTYVQSRVADELFLFKIGGIQNRLIALAREARKQKRDEHAKECDQLREQIKHDPFTKTHEAWSSVVDALIETHERTPNQEPITNNQEPRTNSNNTNGSSGKPDKPPSKLEKQFEAIWQAYPKREGSNPKNKAFSAFKARVAEGVDPAAMAAGLDRYLRYCQARGSIGTEFVMQAVRFFGKSKEFENDWMITEKDHANSSRPGNADTRSVTEQSTVGRAHAASERRRQDILEKYSHGAGTGHGGPMGPHG